MNPRVLILVAIGAAAGCTLPSFVPENPKDNPTRVASETTGEVVMVRAVPMPGESSQVGSVAGSTVGYVIGASMGDGVGSVIGGAVGATAGKAAGEKTEEVIRTTDGLEITVTLENGQTMTVIQSDDVPFKEGERVRVLIRQDDRGRVMKY